MKEPDQIQMFEEARKLYPGTKRGLGQEFVNFRDKQHNKEPLLEYSLDKVMPLLKPAIENQIAWRNRANGDFRPPWKHFSTWINQQCWTETPETVAMASKKKTKLFPISGRNCSKQGCRMPAVYKEAGAYDHYYCSQHMPEKVKEEFE